MASEEEIFLSVFDCYWFEYKILTSKLPPFPAPKPNPVVETHGNSKLISSIPARHGRSLSDHCFSPTDFLSPKSVQNIPKLETILSGKEVRDQFSEPTSKQEAIKKTGGEIKKRRRKHGRVGGGSSKSLSELEFDELKGFMDLGFVFSEEDKVNSSLVSIIPGLQRLGRKSSAGSSFGEEETEKEEEGGGGGGEVKEVYEVDVARPYLSEAWNHVFNREGEIVNPVIDWRIPSLGNEMEIKDQIRMWAQTVASTVR